MKKQISVIAVLIGAILFNGCFATSNMQKAPQKILWDKNKQYKDCDDSQIPIGLSRIYAYATILIGTAGIIARLKLDVPTKVELYEELLVYATILTYGIFQYKDTNTAIQETQKCSEYKTFMLSK